MPINSPALMSLILEGRRPAKQGLQRSTSGKFYRLPAVGTWYFFLGLPPRLPTPAARHDPGRAAGRTSPLFPVHLFLSAPSTLLELVVSSNKSRHPPVARAGIALEGPPTRQEAAGGRGWLGAGDLFQNRWPNCGGVVRRALGVRRARCAGRGSGRGKPDAGDRYVRYDERRWRAGHRRRQDRPPASTLPNRRKPCPTSSPLTTTRNRSSATCAEAICHSTR